MKTIDKDGKGGEKINVSGYEMKKILDWRMVSPPAGSDYFTYNLAAETDMHNLVKYNADPAFVVDANRGFARLLRETDQARGSTYLLNARWNTTILEELAQCSLATGYGSWIEFYPTPTLLYFMFKTSPGVDRRASQSTNDRVIFNTDYGTVKSVTATDTDATYKSLAYVGGQGLGAARTIRTVYLLSAAPTDILRREMFVDARDLSANADLDSRGAAKLTENSYTLFLDAQVLAVSSIQFGVDYDLGDLCTVSQFGLSVDARITKVKEYWIANDYQVDLTFDKRIAEIGNIVRSNNTRTGSVLNALG
jgi:hypothetical protein